LTGAIANFSPRSLQHILSIHVLPSDQLLYETKEPFALSLLCLGSWKAIGMSGWIID